MRLSKREAVEIVRRWCARNKKTPLLSRPRHLQRHAVVVGYAAPRCLVVRCESREAEKHMREWVAANPLDTIHCFDPMLREGDPCITAYVSTEGCGESVAVPLPRKWRAVIRQFGRKQATS